MPETDVVFCQRERCFRRIPQGERPISNEVDEGLSPPMLERRRYDLNIAGSWIYIRANFREELTAVIETSVPCKNQTSTSNVRLFSFRDSRVVWKGRYNIATPSWTKVNSPSGACSLSAWLNSAKSFASAGCESKFQIPACTLIWLPFSLAPLPHGIRRLSALVLIHRFSLDLNPGVRP